MARLSKAIRERVRTRANGRCEYCQKPEGYSIQKHHVDHIIARKHKGDDRLNNLAWACFQCNVCKGSNIASVDSETRQLVYLYHPRQQDWDEHFRFDGVLLVAKTAVARVTIDILQMNHPDQLEMRRFLIENDLW